MLTVTHTQDQDKGVFQDTRILRTTLIKQALSGSTSTGEAYPEGDPGGKKEVAQILPNTTLL